ncbi:flagellin N-terminal helical domain-containing protein [Niameybacter massiliensis]|uniref:flagellin N-terminal helical domain-containing protein n=1 Tax=Niameybacter massiliensis TaxID=1658108 RepID=UPI0006B57798|nr:flagellin [Niameybacter massiliensis]
MKINYNIPALRTLNSLSKANDKAATTMQRLSSGLRINRSADDAAGLAIANKMDAQIKGLQQANRNTMDGVSLVQTAEGTLNEVHSMLQRMRELSVQASNGSYSEGDLTQIQQEIDQLLSEINRISEDTEFNTKSLLKGETLKETGFTFVDMTGGADGTPGTEATGSITIPSPLTEEEAKKLLGSGFTIDGQVVEFYDSTNGTYNGSGVGVDLKEILSTTIADDIDRSNKLTENLQKSLDGKLENVTMTVDTTDTNKLVITANEPGAQGNFIKTEDQGIVDQKITLQIGSNKQQVMVVSIGSMSADKLGLVGKPGQDGFADTATVTNGKDKAPTQAAISVGNSEDAGKAITKIDQAIEMVSSQRAALGAVQNRLEHTTSNLGVSEENMTSSLSRIQDADMAYEMAQYTQQNVLSQAATAMLAQANQRPQQVMQLLQR